MAELFRRATINELDEVNNILIKIKKHMNETNLNQWDEIYPTESILENDIKNNELYVLLQNNIIVSFIVLNENQEELYKVGKWQYTSDKIAVIHRLCVNPEVQNKGLGRKILALSEEFLKSSGYMSIRLDAFTKNSHALNLYTKSGYTKTGIVTFRKGDFYLFEKLL